MSKIYFSLTVLILFTVYIYPQTKQPNKSKFQIKKEGFFETHILKSIEEFEKPKVAKKKIFRVDLKDNPDLPKSPSEFHSYWHNPPEPLGNHGICWDFAATSLFESEIYRLTKKKVKLSEMWVAYWEYVTKASAFVDSRGKTRFSRGSEFNALKRIYKKYGIVPQKDYTGLKPGQEFPNRARMFKEMKEYLNSVKRDNAWSKKIVITTIKSILERYLGKPPKSVMVGNKVYTPKEYLNDYLKFNVDNYVSILSLEEKPFYEKVEYPVPDNWWHSKEYYNVPIKDFMNAIKKAAKNGYTMAFEGDVSEPGIIRELDVCVVPSFDIPSSYIDDNARELRFNNHTTTDDHGIHMVGYLNKNGQDWYLIKDAGDPAFDGRFKGYFFFSSDYVKLKMLAVMVHKDAVKDLLKKFAE